MSPRTNLLSVDLEDWYLSGYLRDYVNPEKCEPRIEQATLPILDLFKRKNVKATFFVLGCIADKHPELIRKIAEQGHEIASHGYSHIPLWKLTPEIFRDEIRRTNTILESISEKKVKGFRAAYASIEPKTAWAIKILEEEGFQYDSSIFPMRTPIYGVPGAPEKEYQITAENILQHNPHGKIIEIPFTVFNTGFFKIPCTGGIYGRMLPTAVFKFLLKQVQKRRPVNFYFHPWETDAEMPRIKAPLYNRFVSYYNVTSYLDKISATLDSFRFTSFKEYLALPDSSL